jgi:hypothetical protein
VTAVRSQYLRTFIEGVGPIPDTFTATVDWGTGRPGSVSFTLGNLSETDETPGTAASATLNLEDLTATAPIVVVATSAAGLASARFTGEMITIAPPPAWARDWDVALGTGSVTYTARVPVDASALVGRLSKQIPGDVPIVSGPVGLAALAPIATIVVDSIGGVGEGALDGKGRFDLRISTREVRFSGPARARLTVAGVQLENAALEGVVEPYRPSATYDLADLFSLPWPVRWFARSLPRVELRAEITGDLDGTIAGRGDRLEVATGYLRVNIGFVGGPEVGVDRASAGFGVTGGFALYGSVLPRGSSYCRGEVGLVGYVTWRGNAYPAAATTPFRCD